MKDLIKKAQNEFARTVERENLRSKSMILSVYFLIIP